MKRKQRILCICKGGNVRSVHLAYLLKYRYGFDALAAGHEGNTKATVAMLCEWADMIIVVQTHMQTEIPKRFHKKLSIYDIGEDKWLVLNVQILELFDGMIQQALKAPVKTINQE